jgi:hypothetical protein
VLFAVSITSNTFKDAFTDTRLLGMAGVEKPRHTAEQVVRETLALALLYLRPPQSLLVRLTRRCLCPRTVVAEVALEARRVKEASMVTVSTVRSR